MSDRRRPRSRAGRRSVRPALVALLAMLALVGWTGTVAAAKPTPDPVATIAPTPKPGNRKTPAPVVIPPPVVTPAPTPVPAPAKPAPTPLPPPPVAATPVAAPAATPPPAAATPTPGGGSGSGSAGSPPPTTEASAAATATDDALGLGPVSSDGSSGGGGSSSVGDREAPIGAFLAAAITGIAVICGAFWFAGRRRREEEASPEATDAALAATVQAPSAVGRAVSAAGPSTIGPVRPLRPTAAPGRVESGVARRASPGPSSRAEDPLVAALARSRDPRRETGRVKSVTPAGPSPRDASFNPSWVRRLDPEIKVAPAVGPEAARRRQTRGSDEGSAAKESGAA